MKYCFAVAKHRARKPLELNQPLWMLLFKTDVIVMVAIIMSSENILRLFPYMTFSIYNLSSWLMSLSMCVFFFFLGCNFAALVKQTLYSRLQPTVIDSPQQIMEPFILLWIFCRQFVLQAPANMCDLNYILPQFHVQFVTIPAFGLISFEIPFLRWVITLCLPSTIIIKSN